MRTGIRHIAVLLLILSGYAASAQLHTESRMDFIQADIQRIDKLFVKEYRKL
jgi:hypothetical protein